jgi:NADH dehydrogenase
MRVAITGGTGFVGSELAEWLTANGHEAVVISRRVGVDIQDQAALCEAVRDCDAIAHCAGINRELGAQTYENVHVRGTANVIDAAKTMGVKKLLLLSFLRARPDCGSAYHESKWAAEELLRESGLDYTILKAGVIYGRGDHMLDHLSRAFHTFPVFGFVGYQSQLMRPVTVHDVVRIIKASVVDGRLAQKTVVVTGPEALTLQQAVKRVAAVVGKRPFYFRMPVLFHYGLARVCENVMKTPMVGKAQVRMLSESLVETTTHCDKLPQDLVPEQAFTSEKIRQGLPAAEGFGINDLWNPCRSHACA